AGCACMRARLARIVRPHLPSGTRAAYRRMILGTGEAPARDVATDVDLMDESGGYSPFATFTREEWSALRGKIPVPLREEELEHLQGINEELSMEEVADIYLPLARLINLHVAAAQQLHRLRAN